MEKLLAAEEAALSNEHSDAVRKAAHANTAWSGVLVVVLLLTGAIAGGSAGNAAAGRYDGTVPAIFGAVFGGFAGLLSGMVIFSQRRLESAAALRTDDYFTRHERHLL